MESIVSVINQVQLPNPAPTADMTPYTGCFILEAGGGMESDAAAGTAINALFRCTAGNVSVLTAGALELSLLVLDAPQAALGVG